MKNRNLIVLGGVAVVLAVVAMLVGGKKGRAPSELKGKDVFPGLVLENVSEVRFGDKLKLSAADDGWKIDTYYGYPADVQKLKDNLLKLTHLKVTDVVRGKKLEKTEDLVLSGAGGREVAKLAFGPCHEKWGHGRYARFSGETVLVSDMLDALDGDAKRWCETKIADEPWISFNEVMDPKADAAAYGFATGVVAKVKIGADTNRTVTVGAAVKGGTDRYVKLDGSDWVYAVPSYSVESLLPKPKEEPKPKEDPKPAPANPEPAAKPEATPKGV